MRGADTELFKDKIEVSLDGRQVFYLFFGGAVITSLVFVLGVMVGRRVEARNGIATAPATSAARDPLAALDQLGAEERGELVFPAALSGDPAAEKTLLGPVARPAAKLEAKPVKPVEAKPPPVKAAEPVKPPAVKPPEVAPPVAEAAGDGRGRFTLQLSSFQDRAEAEAFLAQVRAAGDSPYLIESQVPDKGTWFRVRLGRYLTHGDALAAKTEFEKRQKIIAYVTRL